MTTGSAAASIPVARTGARAALIAAAALLFFVVVIVGGIASWPTRSRVQTRPSLKIRAWTGRMRSSSVAMLSACIAIFLALALFGVATAEREASRAGKDPD